MIPRPDSFDLNDVLQRPAALSFFQSAHMLELGRLLTRASR